MSAFSPPAILVSLHSRVKIDQEAETQLNFQKAKKLGSITSHCSGNEHLLGRIEDRTRENGGNRAYKETGLVKFPFLSALE